MAKKSFKQQIKHDFKQPTIEKTKTSPSETRHRTKPVSGARLIPLSDIQPDPEQPRKNHDTEKLKDMAQSIKSKGLIEPITVRHSDDSNYIIITGERRFKASKIAGLQEIPCIIKKVDEKDILSIQLIENLQRENLNAVEESQALKRLISAGMKQSEAAKLIGKSQPYISQSLKILQLPENILKEALKNRTPKEQLLQQIKDQKPKRAKAGRPKIKPWTWKPDDKSFTVSIRFKKKDYGKTKVIDALEQIIEQMRTS